MKSELCEILERAERALERGLSREEKLNALEKLRSLVDNRQSTYVRAIVEEAKKPWLLADGEVKRALTNIEEAIRFIGTSQDKDIDIGDSTGGEGKEAVWRAFPRGVVLGITPYNFPLNLVLHKVLPAICSGAPIILKPDPRTPAAAVELQSDLDTAGLPEGFVQVLQCNVEDVEELCLDERVEVISFTGSEKVGWYLKAKHPSKHVVLELGGTATALYAKPEIDKKEVEALTRAALGYSGQVCISTQNILVPRSLLHEMQACFQASMREVKRGTPEAEDTLYGPVIDQRHADGLIAQFEKAVDDGAEVWMSGEDDGLNLAARLITLPHHRFEIAREEIFGPALVLIPYDDDQEALMIFREIKSTLQAAVFTDDDERWDFFQARIRTGALLRNRPPTFRVDSMPYGGVKTSGVGREGVAYAFEEFSERRLIIA